MKKIYILLLCLVTAQTAVNGQFTKLGGGLGYSTGFPFHNMKWAANRSGHLNFSLKGIYQIGLPIQISPSFTYMVPHITKETQYGETITTTVSSLMIDIDGHYIFNTLNRFELYGLVGLDILITGKKEAYSSTPSETSKEKDDALGLNLGAGTYFKISEQVDLYGSLKYLLGRYDQFIVNAGVLVNLNWLAKHEHDKK